MAGKIATTEKIGRVGQRRQVVIPREMLETLNIQEGDFVAFSEQANGVLIKPKRVVDPDAVLTPAQRRIIDRGIAKGLEDIKRGRLQGPFSSHKEFIDSLHEEAGNLTRKKTKRSVR